MEKIWKTAPLSRDLERQLAKELEISPLFARLLINRGIRDSRSAKIFLSPELDELHSPFLLNDMTSAVNKIREAIEARKKILIYGDYDVDGITGVALLVLVLQRMGALVSYYIPHRIREGYGLNKGAIEKASQEGIGLIITVDCGVSALEEVAYAHDLGIEVIITDHHEAGESLPQSVAVIDPKRLDSTYPFDGLAGVGVAFKLAQALQAQTEGSHLSTSLTPCGEHSSCQEHLDLVALGTIADIVPLTGENRILVRHGLKTLAQTERPGLKALMEVGGLEGKEVTAGQVGFVLAPRINAGGRIGEAEQGVRLLLSGSREEALPLANSLDRENRLRQEMQSQTVDEAVRTVKEKVNLDRERVIVLSDDGWHPGVIGIVASRLVERFYRPVILIAPDEEVGKGSARSIEGFHLLGALTECQDLLLSFGGHSLAAGLTISREEVGLFRERINEVAQSQLGPKDLIPKLNIDAPLSLKEMSLELIESLGRLHPFGAGNPRPVFSSTQVDFLDPPFLVRNNHLKLRLTDGTVVREAIGFRMGDKLSELGGKTSQVDVAYSLEVNQWRGGKSIQLHLKDIKVADKK